MSAVLFPSGTFACTCNAGHSACREVASGEGVFIGKVLSVSPPFVNRLNPASRMQAGRVLQFHDQLDSGAAAQSLESLKETFRQLAPGISPDQSSRLKEANSRQALLQLFDAVLDQGSYVTLRVQTVFTAGHDDDGKKPAAQTASQSTTRQKNAKDDDDDKPSAKAKGVKPKDNDDDAVLTAGTITSVRTPTFDCGVEFQVGETYLVYASMDEDTDIAETDICMGTRRLSDAGADLPYLTFLKADPEEAGHLDGFVTTNPAAAANPPQSDQISNPLIGALIELQSDESTRYATSDREGRFVFDGLSPGSYRITAYGAEYPDPNQVVSASRDLTIARACTRHVVLAQPAVVHN